MNSQQDEARLERDVAGTTLAGHDRRPGAARAASAPARGWALLVRAVAGSEEDFTSGSIGRAVFLLAVPMVLEMLMESLFAVCDMYFVSRLDVNAVAAVGLTEAVVTLVYAVAVGLSMATTAMVARRIGEGDREAAAEAAVQAIALGVGISALISLAGAVLADDLLRLMGGSPALVAGGTGFTRVIFAGSSTILLLFLINAVFRGAGDAAVAMRVLWLANGINIVLDPCLIFGLGPFPELGLTGAAVATTIGRGTGVLFQLWLLARGRGRVRVGRAHLRLCWPVIRRLARVSLGGIGQYAISTTSWVVVVKIISGFGSAAVAGYTIAIRIVVFTLMPAWGIANAAATLTGQNLGAGKPERAARAVWRTGLYNVAFMVGVAVLFVLGAESLVRIFRDDPDVVRHGVDCLRLISYGYGFYAIGMVIMQAFNGAGDTITPTVINMFCYWLFQLPLAYLLAHPLGMQSRGVFLAIMVAESVLAVVGVLVFRRGRWRERTI